MPDSNVYCHAKSGRSSIIHHATSAPAATNMAMKNCPHNANPESVLRLTAKFQLACNVAAPSAISVAVSTTQ